MRVLRDQKKGIITLRPLDVEEEAILQKIIVNKQIGDILKYDGRGGANRMWLCFYIGIGDSTFKLSGTADDDDKAVRNIRDAIFFGGRGLIFIGHTEVNGKPSLDFTIEHCKVCNKPMISMIECEWQTCNACAEKCEHNYVYGAVHGGGIDIGLGEYCDFCGRGKPKILYKNTPI
jgi:hypothetical protein